MWLVCSNRCGAGIFRSLQAEVDVDAAGAYESHRFLQPGFICVGCGAPALDLGQVPAEMAADAEEDVAPALLDVLCPVCETAVPVLEVEMECPNCGAYLEPVS
ncbi:MAG: hypothetical protein E6I70_12000 [Chloroflexi bacterium]|nr:MAG: hypothetical protein E6I63_05890 [Chloroflexota bacterium]TME16669.1 MAG: hypothetical protein E6I70_12000 [Chloroflexota bacterium]